MSQMIPDELGGAYVPPPDYDSTLFVIFHGAIAFYDDPALPWIDAFIANLQDDHVYVAGKFLGECRIPAGSILALSGVTPGTASFDDAKDRFLHYTGPGDVGGARVHLENVYSRLVFPRPDAILHAFNFKRSDHKDPREICIVPVFQYRFPSVDALKLRMFLDHGMCCTPGGEDPDDDSFDWKPTACDPTPLTLHVRAEEDRDDPQPDRDHDAALQIIGQADFDTTPWDTFDRGDTLPGFSPDRTFWEIDLSLRKRIDWLTTVGARIQRHPPAPSTPFTVIAPPPFKDDDPSCGPGHGGPG